MSEIIFRVGDKVRLKKELYEFWESWFKRSFDFEDVVTLKYVEGNHLLDGVAFEESAIFIALIEDIEHAVKVDKDGQIKLPFKGRFV